MTESCCSSGWRSGCLPSSFRSHEWSTTHTSTNGRESPYLNARIRTSWRLQRACTWARIINTSHPRGGAGNDDPVYATSSRGAATTDPFVLRRRSGQALSYCIHLASISVRAEQASQLLLSGVRESEHRHNASGRQAPPALRS